MKLYQLAAGLIVAIRNCNEPGFNGCPEYPARHVAELERLAREFLPSGSGFDSGSTFDLDKSSPQCLVINTSFHHMDDYGGYCGWTDHVIRARADLAHGFTLTISGRNYRDIKDYIGETFDYALNEEH